jgi:hypothetical protein
MDEFRGMIQEWLENGKLELSQGSYSNKWFVTTKKNGKLRLIMDCQPLNAVSRRMAGTLPLMDEISERLAGYWGYIQLDVHAMFDQFTIDPVSRDLFAFNTPLGNVRLCVLPMGYQNSPFLTQTAMDMIFKDIDHKEIYVDDFTLVTADREFNDEVMSNGMRVSIHELIARLEAILKRALEVGLTFGGTKMRLFEPEIEVLGYKCGTYGRSPQDEKVQAMLSWPEPTTVKEVRSFVQAAAFYRSWIRDFSIKMEPLFRLTRKGVPFTWGAEQRHAFVMMKDQLASEPVLQSPIYDGRVFYLTTDGGPVGGGATLCQEDAEGQRFVIRYMSFLWSAAERNYAQIKKELAAMVRALKGAKGYIYGAQVIIETDCLPLIGYLNNKEVLDPILSRWMAYVHMFAPIFKHIAGKTNVVADGLSREGSSENPSLSEEVMERELARVFNLSVTGNDPMSKIKLFLTSLKRPDGMKETEYKTLLKDAEKFFVKGDQLFTRPTRKYEIPRLVVQEKHEKAKIMFECHDGLHGGGHKGLSATYGKVAHRFFWPCMYKDVAEYVKTCEVCQRLSVKRLVEPLKSYRPRGFNKRWSVDILQITQKRAGKRFDYVIIARDEFGWIEGKPLRTKKAEEWVRFLFEHIVCRWGVGQMIVTDNGELQSTEAKSWAERFRLWITYTTSNHPESNGLVERGHQGLLKSIAASLQSYEVHESRWDEVFYATLWAMRITVNRVTGFTPFYMMYGQEAVVPMEFEANSWRVVEWRDPMTSEELIACRTRQLLRLECDRKVAEDRVNENRAKDAERWENSKNVRKEALVPGDYVLLWDSKRSASFSMKLDNRWQGPYKIIDADENGTYRLAELDGAKFARRVAGALLKKFYVRVCQGTTKLEPPVDVVKPVSSPVD